MGDDAEEAELRKEQLRLQNALIAQQLQERAKAEQRAEVRRSVMREAQQTGAEAAKWIFGTVIVAFGIIALICVVAVSYSSCEESRKRDDEIGWAKRECAKGGKVIVRYNGEIASIDAEHLPEMRRLGAREKTCSEVERGQLP